MDQESDPCKGHTKHSLPASLTPIKWAPLVMRNCGDDNFIALNRIDQVVWKTAENKFAKFLIHRTADARL